MPNKYQIEFSKLSQKNGLNVLWHKKPNAWYVDLSNTTRGTIAKELARNILGGTLLQGNIEGYDIFVNDQKIQVKTSSLQLRNEYPVLSWKQIRPNDPYTHILFIAVYPSDVRMFLVPRNDIPFSDLHQSHGGKRTSAKIYNIETRKTDELFSWMTKHELL